MHMQRIFNMLPFSQWIVSYKKGYLKGDLFAGITVGVMLIPQGMAYALIAGLPPVYGLYASIVPQIIYAILGTSRQLSVAPVAMDSLLVAAGVSVLATEGSAAYIAYAILVAFFMGVFQLTLGVFKLGFVTNLLSKPVISGFTSAAAVIIGLNQLKYVFGVPVEKSSLVHEIVIHMYQVFSDFHGVTLVIAIFSIALIVGAKRLNENIPASLLVVALGILGVYLLRLDLKGVEIIREIPQGLPAFVVPVFSMPAIGSIIPLAFTISIIAFVEAYSVAKAIENKQQDHKVHPNKELIGLGASNIVGSFFQSFPVTGGFSRTAVNYQAGANTPLASVISALLVGLTLLFLTPLFYYLPLAILGAIVLVAVSNLFDLQYAGKLWRESKKEFLILLLTFLVTLNVGMVTGIATGIITSILLFLYRSAYPHIAQLGKIKGHHEFRNVTRFKDLETWDGIVILRVDAPLSFINIQEIKDYILQLATEAKTIQNIIIDAGPVSHIDITASEVLHTLLEELKKHNIRLILCDVIGPVRDTMKITGLTERIGNENLFLSLNEALDNALSNTKDPYTKVTLQTNVKTT